MRINVQKYSQPYRMLQLLKYPDTEKQKVQKRIKKPKVKSSEKIMKNLQDLQVGSAK